MKSYSRAKLEILSYIFSFGIARVFSNGEPWVSKDSVFKEDRYPALGTLVTPTHARGGHKWYLGWLRQIETFSGGNVYHIESLEDGQICKWSNVGLMVFSPETVEKYPSWKWTDEQFKFNDQWVRACYKTRDAYILRPNQCEFFEDGSVNVSLRVMFQMDDAPPSKKYPDFKKVKVRDLLSFYDESVKWKESKRA